MVDAEYLGFIKDPRHGLVDLPGGIQVVPDRLLHDDPREGSLAARWLDQAGVSKPLHHVGDRGDRKSTRLNSSHSQISYAVFCLKKKKERERPAVIREVD